MTTIVIACPGRGIGRGPAGTLAEQVREWTGARRSGSAERPDGSRLGYIADQDVDELYNLYETDPGNPGAAVRMTPDAAGSGVYDFLYSSDGTKIVYSSSQDDDFSDLYRLDTATPGDSTRLNAAMVAGGEVWSFNLTE